MRTARSCQACAALAVGRDLQQALSHQRVADRVPVDRRTLVMVQNCVVRQTPGRTRGEGGDYWLPDDVMNSSFELDGLVERLLSVDRPILVSAGPASCIIHKYWQRAVKRQVIVDVGSAIDERTKRRKTRQYQVAGTRTAELCCTW